MWLPLAGVLKLQASPALADRTAQVLLAKQMMGSAPPPPRVALRPPPVRATIAALEARPVASRGAVPWWFRPEPKGPPSEPKGMWAESIHDAPATGLRLSGTGEGSGHRASGNRVHGIATVGQGQGVPDLEGFDHRRDGVAHEHVTKAPPPSDGRVPPPVIEAVVRANFGRFQVCYDTGLRAHPGLSGRVAVKFVIDRRGAVAVASDAGSDLPDADVVTCVVRAFDALSFPASRDSVVTVVYPIVFSPAPAK